MTFNSPEFFVFLVVVYVLYRAASFCWQQYLLLIASFVFYGWWDVRFLYLLSLSAALDFCIGMLLGRDGLPRLVRLQVSSFLVAAAVFFTGVQWSAIRLSLSPLGASVDWERLGRLTSTGEYVVAGTLLGVVFANLGYPALIRSRHRRHWLLAATIVVNLTILGFFKYFNFFIASGEQALQGLGIAVPSVYLNIILPLGISFYTFESMSYCFDIDRGIFKPVDRLFHYLLFVSYFPHLVAGPIVRAGTLLPQLTSPRTIRFEDSMRGLSLIVIGLFKKVAVADGVAPSVASVYGSSGHATTGDIVLATLLFAVQIYCDFSGYSDIAIGVSQLFGIEIPRNFALPYFARNPREFWQRWHISLSSWLRDYVYIPLGGDHRGPLETYRNLMLTMLLGGLWHGAAWNFVLWGAYQGLLLCGYRLLTDRPALPSVQSAAALRRQTATSAGQALIFFVLTCCGWLLFRATSVAQIGQFIGTLVGFGAPVASVIHRPTLAALGGVPVLFGLELLSVRSGALEMRLPQSRPARGAVYAVLILLIVMGTANAPVQFIYFQF